MLCFVMKVQKIILNYTVAVMPERTECNVLRLYSQME